MREDPGIETLLNLHDQIIDQGDGYWIKIEAWKTDPIKPPKKLKHAGRILAYDHKHRHVSDKGTPYEFKDAHQLLADFFAEVDRVLREVKKR